MFLIPTKAWEPKETGVRTKQELAEQAWWGRSGIKDSTYTLNHQLSEKRMRQTLGRQKTFRNIGFRSKMEIVHMNKI